MRDLTEKTAVITGAASGIGVALARRLAQEGTRLVLADVDQKALDTEVEELRAQGAIVLGVRTDVSDEESVLAMARIGQGAMTAADVAELTVEAIKRDRFWVLPNPSFESSIPEALKR